MAFLTAEPFPQKSNEPLLDRFVKPVFEAEPARDPLISVKKMGYPFFSSAKPDNASALGTEIVRMMNGLFCINQLISV